MANTWWRNKYSAAASTDKTNIIDRMNALDLQLKRVGADHTDIVIAGATLFPIYESALQPLQRFTTSKSADAGFLSYSYKDKEVFYDYNCPTKSMYFLDTDRLSFRYFTDRWFDVGDATPSPMPTTKSCGFGSWAKPDLFQPRACWRDDIDLIHPEGRGRLAPPSFPRNDGQPILDS